MLSYNEGMLDKMLIDLRVFKAKTEVCCDEHAWRLWLQAS